MRDMRGLIYRDERGRAAHDALFQHGLRVYSRGRLQPLLIGFEVAGTWAKGNSCLWLSDEMEAACCCSFHCTVQNVTIVFIQPAFISKPKAIIS